MTTYKSEFNAPLSRYNARKRELQNSMLEYSERVRNIHHLKDENYLAGSNAPLEIHARRKNIVRNGEPGLLSKSPNRRQRPLSLDEKELLRNKELNRSIVQRDAKSEYRRQPIVVPTTSGPPNSPDNGKSNNFRVSLVSASDLYDLVDFGKKSKSPRHGPNRLPSLEEGVKLIEHIDQRARFDRKTAWGRTKDNSENNSFQLTDKKNPDNVDKFGGFLTGRSISKEPKSKNKDIAVPVINADKKSVHFKDNLRVITSPDKREIYPLNVFLETAAASCVNLSNKLYQRPKRAKRMQLHKSNLLVIPEDGDSITSGKNASLPKQIPSSSSLAAIKEGKSERRKQERANIDDETVNDDDVRGSGSSRINSNSSCDNPPEAGDRRLIKHKKRQNSQREETCQLVDDIIIKNSLYPTLPWENEGNYPEMNVRQTNNTGKHRKVKRLVFLRDQPDQSNYRRT